MNPHKSINVGSFILLILVISTLLASNFTNTIAQSKNPESIAELVWTKTYGGLGTEKTNAFIQTKEGDFVLAGLTTSLGSEKGDLIVVKTNSKGETLWTKSFGGSELDQANSITQTLDGGILVAGLTSSFGLRQQAWLLKLDSTGELLWNQTYGGASHEDGLAVTQTPNGDIAVAGWTMTYGDGFTNMWLIKSDSNGNMLWNQTYGGSFDNDARSIIQTTDGGFVLAGRTNTLEVYQSDIWLVKTDSDGTELWNQTYGGPNWDLGNVVLETDSNFILGGQSLSYGDESGDMILVYTDKNGEILWNQTYGGEGIDTIKMLVQTFDGDVVLAGTTKSLDRNRNDLRLIKTNTTGYPVWEYSCCNGSTDSAIGLVQITENSFIILGQHKNLNRILVT